MNAQMTTLKYGDKIQTIYGNWFVVFEVIGNVVYVLGNNTVHITKIARVISK